MTSSAAMARPPARSIPTTIETAYFRMASFLSRTGNLGFEGFRPYWPLVSWDQTAIRRALIDLFGCGRRSFDEFVDAHVLLGRDPVVEALGQYREPHRGDGGTGGHRGVEWFCLELGGGQGPAQLDVGVRE